MLSKCNWIAATLGTVAVCAAAQSPYTINGLHSEMTLREAVAQTERLGGHCEVSEHRPAEQVKSIQCEFRHCELMQSGDACDAADLAQTAPGFAGHSFASIGLLGSGDNAQVTRIVMTYAGDTDTLAAALVEAFGPTELNGTPTDKASWTHARRWSWRSGLYRMGLLNSPQWIVLATDQAPAVPDPGAGVDVVH